MSEQIKTMFSFDRVLTRLDLLLGILVLVCGMLVTAGATYARVRSDLDNMAVRIKAIEDDRQIRIQQYEKRAGKMERNLVRIGVKLGLAMEDPD